MKKNGRLVVFSPNHIKQMDLSPFMSQWKDFLTLSLERCMQAVGAGSGSIFLLDDDKKDLILAIARSGESLGLEGTRASLGDRIAGRVALKGEPLLVKDIDKEPSLKSVPRFNHYKSKSFLSAPLESSGELIGVINLTDKPAGRAFNDKDLHAVLINCRYVGTALHILKRYLDNQKDLNQEFAKELEGLKRSVEGHKKFSSLGKFVGGLVHEINNPLDGVIRYVNLTLDSLKEDDISKEYLLEAKKGLNRIAKFVRSLLDFSWSLSSSGREADINKAVEECLFQFSQKFTSYNIRVEKMFCPDLPKMPDYGLKIIFNNIIKNAVEAMEVRGGFLRISTVLVNGGLEIVFADTGKGIPVEVQGKIFDPFFTTKNMGEGSGLGLAISSEILDRYQGKISVESQENLGATLRITLPLKNKIL